MFDVLGYVVDVSIVPWVMVLGLGGAGSVHVYECPPTPLSLSLNKVNG
jgi:hypothetical protein